MARALTARRQRRRPFALWQAPETTAAQEHEPARVIYYADSSRRATVYHVAGPMHPNAQRTALRLRAQGFTVTLAFDVPRTPTSN